MRITLSVLTMPLILLIFSGCTSLPQQASGPNTQLQLVGSWTSADFDGLSANEFDTQRLVFKPNGTFEEKTTYRDGGQTQLTGVYRVDGDHIILDSGDGYAPRVPFYLHGTELMIKRRSSLGRVRVTLVRESA